VIKAFDEAGLRPKVKLIVGGAPVTQEWANQIGADAYAPDAATAVDRCKELLGAA
jgi:5-methyltetrahydrofolate--homocysteine methyltransferase